MNIFMRSFFVIVALVYVSSVEAISSGQNGVKLDNTEISSISAFLGVLIGAFVTYWSFKRKQYSEIVTTERLNFVKEYRECSAKFCELLSVSTQDSDKDTLTYYYYRLLFMCNPIQPESYIDKTLAEMLEQLYKLYIELNNEECKEKDKVKRNFSLMQRKLIAMIQTNLALEWHGVLAESQKGNLSDNQKEKLRQDYYKNYLEYVKKEVVK